MQPAAHATREPSGTNPAPGEGPAIDRAHLDRQTFADPALQVEVLGLFQDELPNALQRLRSAATAKDWHFAAHALKGSARAVGAARLAALALAAEQAAGKPGTRDRLIAEIAAEMTRVGAAVRELVATLAPRPAA